MEYQGLSMIVAIAIYIHLTQADNIDGRPVSVTPSPPSGFHLDERNPQLKCYVEKR